MLDSLMVCKIVLIGGLAVWISVVVLNNASNFVGGAASIGLLMSMRAFEEPPMIQTPLLSRQVTSARWHRLVFAFVLAFEVVVALMLWTAACSLIGAIMGSIAPAEAIRRANLALAGIVVVNLP